MEVFTSIKRAFHMLLQLFLFACVLKLSVCSKTNVATILEWCNKICHVSFDIITYASLWLFCCSEKNGKSSLRFHIVIA